MKPRWLRHRIATPSPSPMPRVAQRVGQRVGAPVDLAEGQRAELVDDRRRVGVADRGRRVAGGRRRAPAAQRVERPAHSRRAASGARCPRSASVLAPCSSFWRELARWTFTAREPIAIATVGASARLARSPRSISARMSAGAARVEEDVALADARLLGRAGRRRAAPRRPPRPARGRCRRSRAPGGRTRCGSRPTCPCRRGAAGSAARRGGRGRGRRAGARRPRAAASSRASTASSCSATDAGSAGRPPRRGDAPRRRAAGARRRSARAGRSTSASTPAGSASARARRRSIARDLLLEGERRRARRRRGRRATSRREVAAERAGRAACRRAGDLDERADERGDEQPGALVDGVGVGAQRRRDGRDGAQRRRSAARPRRRPGCS